MRRQLLASATLALLFLLCACGSGSTQNSGVPPSTCGSVSSPDKATVVVTHSSGATVQRCVGFSAAAINGATLMQKSKFAFTTQTFSFGKAACAIDNQPQHFSQCLPKSGDYWALYTLAPGGGHWKEASTGYTGVSIPDGGALGWRYESETASPAPTPALPKK